MDNKKKLLRQIATKLRIHSVNMTSEAGSGHPTTCMSIAEIMACLFFDEMRYNIKDPFDWANDELVLSKGHAAPILWACYAEAGIFPVGNLKNLRKITSNLEGHPTPRMKWVKAATGSLGQGLSVGVGIAAAMKLARSRRRTYVVLGDGEIAEGSVWEAANSAVLLGLDNLVAIADINRLSQSDATMHGHDLEPYEMKFLAFGWDVIVIDGHKVGQILKAFATARESEKPVMILARTLKGKGVSFLEDLNGWHGKPLKEEDRLKAMEELGPMPEVDAAKLVRKPKAVKGPSLLKRYDFRKNDYDKAAATRRAYGNALVNLGKVNSSVVVLDGDVKNSTYAEDFFKAFPKRSYQVYIAEQNMVGMGLGMAAKGYQPYMATFAAFLSRAHDQIRMAAYSMPNMKFVGSHVGVSIGADGPSQMGLEDIAIFAPIPGCVVFYPSDAYATESCVEEMARYKGMAYLRTTRPGTPLLYKKGEKFPIGGSKVLKRSAQDQVAIIAAGITVFEALRAYEELKAEGTAVRVIDAYSVQPIDKAGLRRNVEAAGGKAVVVEDHFPNGGLGSAAALALGGAAQIEHLAVRELPRSGEPDELMDRYGISARHVVRAVKSLLRK
jgi:transketolase